MSASEIDKLREHFAIEHKADWPSRYSGFSIACLVNEMPSSRARMQEYIEAEDHDRIMAERDELWKRATKFVMPGEMDTGESIEHYIKTLEQAIAELKAEAIRVELVADAAVELIKEKYSTIARQAKVIEKLKAMLNRFTPFEDLKAINQELVAIEQEGET